MIHLAICVALLLTVLHILLLCLCTTSGSSARTRWNLSDWGQRAQQTLYSPEEGVAFVASGFHLSRRENLNKLFCVLDQLHITRALYLYWGNPIEPVSTSDFACSSRLTVLTYPNSSLNNRFAVPPGVPTESICILDDDLQLTTKDLLLAYQVWKEHRNRIVGFFPRAIRDQNEILKYTSATEAGYHIILTKIFFLHVSYLELYTKEGGMKAVVDQFHNCEDIAMNLFVSSVSGLGPLHIQTKVRDLGDSRNYYVNEEILNVSLVGLGNRPSHKGERDACVEKLVAIAGAPHTTVYSIIPSSPEISLCSIDGYVLDCNTKHIRTMKKLSLNDHVDKGAGSNFAFVAVASSGIPLVAMERWCKMLRFHKHTSDLVLLVEEAMHEEVFSAREIRLCFDRVLKVKGIPLAEASKNPMGYLKIRVWELEEYSRVLYMDTDILILRNLEHIFSTYSPFAAAPDVYVSDYFNSGIMLIRPSLSVAKQMLELVNCTESYNHGDQGFFNSFMSSWFASSPEQHLPFRYNFIYSLPTNKGYKLPDWFDIQTYEFFFGEPYIVHFANPWSKPWFILHESGDPFQRAWLDENYRLVGGRDPQLTVELPDKMLLASPQIHHKWRKRTIAYVTFVSQTCLACPLVLYQNLQLLGTQYPLVIAGASPSIAQIQTATTAWKAEKLRLLEVGHFSEGLEWVEALGLREFDLLLYLKCTGLVLRNLDHVFENFKPLAGVPSTYPPDRIGNEILLLEPNAQLRAKLLKASLTWQNYTGESEGFTEWVLGERFRLGPSNHMPAHYRAEAVLKKNPPLFRDFFFFVFDPLIAPWAGNGLNFTVRKDLRSLSQAWWEVACSGDAMQLLHNSNVCKLYHKMQAFELLIK